VGPSSKRKHIFRFLSGGAEWHDSKKASKNSTRVPASKLVAWVQQKLGASPDEALRVAFRVAKSLGKKGLQGNPIVPPTVDEVTSMVITTLNNTIHRMVEELGKHAKG